MEVINELILGGCKIDMSTKKKTYCRNCGAVCGIELEIEANKVIAVKGDQDNPESQGYFCVKGLTSMDFHNGEDRLMSCKKREPDGSFVDIDQESLMDEVAEKLSSIIEAHGPRSVAFFNGTHGYGTLSMPLTKSLMHSIGTPNVFSTMTIDQSAKWVNHGRMGLVPTWKYSDLEADALMVVGNNPIVSHMGKPWSGIRNNAAGQAIREARKRGMKLVVVDPRITETARNADIHLQIRPGDDPILFAGLIHLCIKNGWYDKDFCERYTCQFEELGRAVRAFTPEYVAERLGLEEAQLEEVAHVFGTKEKVSVGSGTGANMSRNSNLSVQMLEAFNAICGGYRKPGDEIPNPGLMSGGIPSVFSIIPANRTWEAEPKAVSDPSIGQLYGEFPSGILADEITSQSPDRIRALFVLGGNPVMAMGDPEITVPAFESLDLMITLDARMTDTAKLSHYVVAPTLPYERHDITMINDTSYHRPFAQYAPPALTPPPGALPDWEFIWGVAKRLGYQLELKPAIFGASFDSLPEGYKLDMETLPEAPQLIEEMCKQSLVSFDDLKAHPSGYAPEIKSVVIAEPEQDDGARLSLMPDDVAAELAAELENYQPGGEFPLLLSTRRLLETMNGSFRDAGKTRNRYKVNPLFMHPDDIEAHNLQGANRVIVESKFGRVSAALKKDPSMKPGVVALTHMWGSALEDSVDNPLGSYTGRLVSLKEGLQTINNMPRYSGVEVSVRAG